MRRLTIGIDASRAFGEEPTGTERYATALIGEMLAEGAHAYRLYCRVGPPAGAVGGAEVRVLPSRRLWTQLYLARELARRPADLVFVPAHVVPFASVVPAVVTVHDLGHRAHPEAHTAGQRWYLELTTRYHVRRCQAILADSQATRDDLVRLYGADADRVHVVHLGVSPSFRPPSSDQVHSFRSWAGVPDSEPYIAHVGTIQPRKNLDRLVAAFVRLLEERDDLWLLLAGRPGWGGADPMSRAASLGAAERVRMLGYVPQDQLPGLYGGAAAVAIPSLYEGFGLPALEAMACGGAVAVSRTSSLPEVVGDAGLLFDPLDVTEIATALRALVEDGPLRDRLAQRGMARAACFTWRRCALETRAVLERAAPEPAARRTGRGAC